MCRIILSSLDCLAVPYFSTSHERYDFKEKVTEHKICVFNLSVTLVRKVFRSEKI